MESLIDYSRQAEMDRILGTDDIGLPIFIIGCGGIGFWLGLSCALYGYEKIYLFDNDVIDKTNLARLPVPPAWIGLSKASALRRLITFLRPDCFVRVYKFKVKEDTKELFKEIFERLRPANTFDTTDNAHDQNLIYKIVSESVSCRYRKLGYEGFKVGTYGNYQVWTASEYTTGYRTTSANVFSSCLAACVGFFASRLTTKDIELDIRDFINKKEG